MANTLYRADDGAFLELSTAKAGFCSVPSACTSGAPGVDAGAWIDTGTGWRRASQDLRRSRETKQFLRRIVTRCWPVGAMGCS